MNHLSALPAWVALTVAALVLLGTSMAFIGSIGLLRLKNFYQRVHAPTLGTTLGTFCTLLASVIYFSVLRNSLAFPEILISTFLTLTAPVTLMLVVRAALHRDEEKDAADVPSASRTSRKQ